MKWLIPFFLILLGVSIFCCGFMYDAVFAGIPYQDPTPELVAKYNFHSEVASLIRWGGAGTCVFGVVVAIGLALARIIRPRRQKNT